MRSAARELAREPHGMRDQLDRGPVDRHAARVVVSREFVRKPAYASTALAVMKVENKGLTSHAKQRAV